MEKCIIKGCIEWNLIFTATCRQGKGKQGYIKSKCERNICQIFFPVSFSRRISLNSCTTVWGFSISRHFFLLFSWKHISNINSCLYDNTHPYSYDLRWRFTTHAQSLLLEEKMSADGKPPHGRRGVYCRTDRNLCSRCVFMKIKENGLTFYFKTR
jgi:hypothetical protein